MSLTECYVQQLLTNFAVVLVDFSGSSSACQPADHLEYSLHLYSDPPSLYLPSAQASLQTSGQTQMLKKKVKQQTFTHLIIRVHYDIMSVKYKVKAQ